MGEVLVTHVGGGGHDGGITRQHVPAVGFQRVPPSHRQGVQAATSSGKVVKKTGRPEGPCTWSATRRQPALRTADAGTMIRVGEHDRGCDVQKRLLDGRSAHAVRIQHVGSPIAQPCHGRRDAEPLDAPDGRIRRRRDEAALRRAVGLVPEGHLVSRGTETRCHMIDVRLRAAHPAPDMCYESDSHDTGTWGASARGCADGGACLDCRSLHDPLTRSRCRRIVSFLDTPARESIRS